MKYLITLIILLALPSCSSTPNKLKHEITGTRVVDLTQPIYQGMVYWPGGIPFEMERVVDYDQGYRLHKFVMGENVGTHMDAPAHFVKGKNAIASIPLEELVVPLAVIDIKEKAKTDADYLLTNADVLAWEAEHGKIEKGSLVALNTGWHAKFDSPEDYINMGKDKLMHFPGFSPESAKLLVERDVAGIAIDTLSLDNGVSKDFATHVVMLNANKYQLENVANLDAVPATGATAIVGVLPVKSGTQAQARVFALIK